MHKTIRNIYQPLPYHPPSPLPEYSFDQEELNQIAMDWGEFDLVIPTNSSNCSKSLKNSNSLNSSTRSVHSLHSSHSNNTNYTNNSHNSNNSQRIVPTVTVIDVTQSTKHFNSFIDCDDDQFERRKRTYEERTLNYNGFVSAAQFLKDQKSLHSCFKSSRAFEE